MAKLRFTTYSDCLDKKVLDSSDSIHSCSLQKSQHVRYVLQRTSLEQTMRTTVRTVQQVVTVGVPSHFQFAFLRTISNDLGVAGMTFSEA
jgi:hypothetical protein